MDDGIVIQHDGLDDENDDEDEAELTEDESLPRSRKNQLVTLKNRGKQARISHIFSTPGAYLHQDKPPVLIISDRFIEQSTIVTINCCRS